LPKSDLIEFSGIVSDSMGGGFYSIKTDIKDKLGTETIIRGRLSGKMKQNKVRVLPGDFVKVHVSPYDMTHGIIVHRRNK